MKIFLVALSFFTRIPINIRTEVSEDEFYKSMALLPVVGMFIGLIMYGVIYVMNFLNLPTNIMSFLLLSFYIWITGGLHIDGFIDSADALLSNRDREKMLEIMKDSRIGAFGAIAIILMLLGLFLIYGLVPYKAFILMPIIGRSCGVFAASMSKYAKDTNDLGRRFVEDMGKKQGAFAIIFSLLAIVVVDYYYLVPFVICMIMTYIYVNVFKKKLHGMTGDTIGMMIELNQAVFLYAAYIFISFIGGFI